jgi:hypothetical protein
MQIGQVLAGPFFCRRDTALWFSQKSEKVIVKRQNQAFIVMRMAFL